jgi:hypothetical protein
MRNPKLLALNVERDSVSAGDDIDAPHAKNFAYQINDTLAEAVTAIVESGYLSKIAGGKATWIVEASDKPVAVVAQQWELPAFLIEPSTLLCDYIIPKVAKQLFFRYWCQIEPNIVFECLRARRPLPDRYGRDE